MLETCRGNGHCLSSPERVRDLSTRTACGGNRENDSADVSRHESKRHVGPCGFSRRVRGPCNRSKPCATWRAVFRSPHQTYSAHSLSGLPQRQTEGGGISFADRDSLLHRGTHGPAIVPGNPDASILIQAVRQDGALTMPPGGKLSAKDIATLKQWIKGGAAWGTKLRANDAPKIR